VLARSQGTSECSSGTRRPHQSAGQGHTRHITLVVRDTHVTSHWWLGTQYHIKMMVRDTQVTSEWWLGTQCHIRVVVRDTISHQNDGQEHTGHIRVVVRNTQVTSERRLGTQCHIRVLVRDIHVILH